MSVKDRIEQLINQYPVFMISKSYCPYCLIGENVLYKYKIPQDKLKVLEIDDDPDMDDIQDYMRKRTGARSVPRIFIKGECIGGGSDAVAADSSGELAKRLKSAGIIN